MNRNNRFSIQISYKPPDKVSFPLKLCKLVCISYINSAVLSTKFLQNNILRYKFSKAFTTQFYKILPQSSPNHIAKSITAMAHEPLISFCLELILLSNKYHDIKQLGEERLIFSYLKSESTVEHKEKLKAEAWRKEQKQRPWRNFAYWFLNG